MSPYLEIHFLFARIGYRPHHFHFATLYPVSDLQPERERIYPHGRFIGHQHVPELIVCLRDKCEVHVPGKTVLRHLEFLTADSAFPVPETADYWEQDWRMTLPVSRIGLPQIFRVSAFQAAQFSPVTADLDCQYSVR